MLQATIKLIEFAKGTAKRRTKEHLEFLDFYEQVVIATPPEVSKQFERLQVEVDGGKSFALDLNPQDWGWWSTRIKEGLRFKLSAQQIKSSIYHRLSKCAGSQSMTEAERKEFIAIVKQNENDT